MRACAHDRKRCENACWYAQRLGPNLSPSLRIETHLHERCSIEPHFPSHAHAGKELD